MDKLTSKSKVVNIIVVVILVCLVSVSYQSFANDAYAKNSNQYSFTSPAISGQLLPPLPDTKLNISTTDTLDQKSAMRALQKTIRTPDSCRDARVQGWVILQFVINAKGQVQNIEPIRSIGRGCGQGVITAIKENASFGKALQPFTLAKTRYILPIMFKILGDEKGELDDLEMNLKKFTTSSSDIILNKLSVTRYGS